jgi:hypothetical protein
MPAACRLEPELSGRISMSCIKTFPTIALQSYSEGLAQNICELSRYDRSEMLRSGKETLGPEEEGRLALVIPSLVARNKQYVSRLS